ncbi:hypothetical protein QCA50_000293 [Cerrena zonata]|uniref:Uncharacterized protein n=1 Tax=Cerrena zonata TaxID=2478898 RepID=A0AAW0GU93_9APHY
MKHTRSIAACRLVIRLQRFNPNEAISHISAAGMSECARSPLRLTQLPSRRYTMPRRPEVLVTTDHYVMEDFTPTPMTVSPTTPISEIKRSMVLEIDRDADDKTDFDSDSTRSVSTKIKPPSLSHAV